MPREKIYISDRNLERHLTKIVKTNENTLKRVFLKTNCIILKFSKRNSCEYKRITVKQFSKKKYDCVQTAINKNLKELLQKRWKQKKIVENNKIWLIFMIMEK